MIAGDGNKKGKGIVKASFGKEKDFEIQKYYENEARFIGVFSRDNMPKK